MKYRVYANNAARENGLPGLSEIKAAGIKAAMKAVIELYYPDAKVGGTHEPSAIGTLCWPEYTTFPEVCTFAGDKLKIERINS